MEQHRWREQAGRVRWLGPFNLHFFWSVFAFGDCWIKMPEHKTWACWVPAVHCTNACWDRSGKAGGDWAEPAGICLQRNIWAFESVFDRWKGRVPVIVCKKKCITHLDGFVLAAALFSSRIYFSWSTGNLFSLSACTYNNSAVIIVKKYTVMLYLLGMCSHTNENSVSKEIF